MNKKNEACDINLEQNIGQIETDSANLGEKLFFDESDEQYILPKYASPFAEIHFLTKETELFDSFLSCKLDKDIDRVIAVQKLNDVLNDLQLAIIIEAGIYEFSIVYSKEKNLAITIIPSVYCNKLSDLLLYLTKDSKIYSKYLFDSLLDKKINAQEVAFYSPQLIDPDQWEIYKKKQELKDYKKNNMAATNLYKCYKCGERRCKVTELQTRSADEPMTSFVTCLICYNTWKH